MRILEFIHDEDHPEYSNIDLWVEENKGFATQKILVYKGFDIHSIDGCDMIILHGGAQHIWNKNADPWLYDEMKYISEAVKKGLPVIGFCLGSQILAEILGGEVYESEENEIGWLRICISQQHRDHIILKGLEDGFEAFMWHSDHYRLPPGCTSLAYTEAARHQIFISDKAPVAGFQFHPEYTKEIIRFSYENYYEEYWKGGRFVVGKEGFLEDLQQRPETYHTFRRLMLNTIAFFQSRFGIPEV